MNSQEYYQRVSTLYLHSKQQTRDRLAEFVLNKLSKTRAHTAAGTKDNEESVSYLLTCAREDGNFKVGGNLNDFEDLLKALGFTIREHVAGRAVRRYVSL